MQNVLCTDASISIFYIKDFDSDKIQNGIGDHDNCKKQEVICALILAKKALLLNTLIDIDYEHIAEEYGKKEDRHNRTLHTSRCFRKRVFKSRNRN